MHSYITPDVSTPCSTACAQAAGAADGVDGAHVMAMAAFDRLAGFEIDAERGAEERLLDVVHGERVAGEQHVDVAGADQILEVGAAAGVHDDRPGDERDAAAGLPSTSRIIAAMRATPTSTRRSDETSLVMNAKPWRSRSWNSGVDADAVDAADDAVARLHVAQLAADGAAVLDDDRPRPCAAARPRASGRRAGPASGGWSSSRNRRARSRRGRRRELRVAARRRCGSRGRPAPRAPASSRLRVGAEIRIAIEDGSSLLRPMSNSQHVERRVVLDDRVEDDVQDLRVDQVAFGLDHLAVCGVGVGHDVSAERSAAPAAAARGSRLRRLRRARGRAPTRGTPRAS